MCTCSANMMSAATSVLGEYKYKREPVRSVAIFVTGDVIVSFSIVSLPWHSKVAIVCVGGVASGISIKVSDGIIVNGSKVGQVLV